MTHRITLRGEVELIRSVHRHDDFHTLGHLDALLFKRSNLQTDCWS